MSRFVKYTGYGNAAGLLAARGLMAGGREEGEYSEDEDTDTEEYKEAKPKYRTLLPSVAPLLLHLLPIPLSLFSSASVPPPLCFMCNVPSSLFKFHR